MAANKPVKNAILKASLGFRQKIAVTLTLLISFIMLISVYLVTLQVKEASFRRAEESSLMIGKMIALAMGEDIVRGNFQSIDYALKEFVKINRIDYCIILDNLGRVISSTDPKLNGKYFSDGWSRSALASTRVQIRKAANNGQPIYDASVPIILGGNKYGVIRVGFTLNEEYASIRSLLLYNLTLGILLIFAGLFIAYGISSTLLGPLNTILFAIESLTDGDYNRKAFLNSSDEFGELANSFNKLTSALKDREESGRFLSKKIWRDDTELNSKCFSGRAIEAAVLYIELSDFSSFIERHSPSEAIDTINSFFEEAVKIITSTGGIIDKFGDASILAVFPVKSAGRWPAQLRAAFTALAVRNSVNMLNFKQAALALEELSMRSGISLGRVIIGNVGAQDRQEFTAIGKTVNRAKKMASLSTLSNNFLPVIDRKVSSSEGDFLTTTPITSTSEVGSDKVEYYLLNGFTNLTYFKERISSSDERDALILIPLFGFTQKTEGFGFLKSLVEDPDSQYRIPALKALSPFVFEQEQTVKDFLQELSSTSEDEAISATAASILGMGRDKKLISFFTRLFNSPNDRLRANAVEACVPLEFPDKQSVLKKMLQDPSPRVCSNALLGLWISDDHDTLSCIYSLLKSDNTNMRASAAYAIYFLASSRKFRRLFPAFSEEKNFLILPIIENILKRLKAMLTSESESERLQAVKAIGNIGDASFKKDLSELLEDENSSEIVNEVNNTLFKWERELSPENG